AWNSVGADYFSTVGLPVTRGRGFTEAEATESGPKVAIIDEVLAKKLWPDGDALGQRIQYADQKGGTRADVNGEEKESVEIVGMVREPRPALFKTEEQAGVIYLPFARAFQSDVSYFVRFRSLAPENETAAADLLRRTVRDLDASIPIISLRT